jgi:hypothetical protein
MISFNVGRPIGDPSTLPFDEAKFHKVRVGANLHSHPVRLERINELQWEVLRALGRSELNLSEIFCRKARSISSNNLQLLWLGCTRAEYQSECEGKGAHRPNESKLSDHWRRRAALRVSVVKSSKVNCRAGQRLAAALG